MPHIEIDFAVFLPSLSTFYSYFELLKEYDFIQDIEVALSDRGDPILRVLRKSPEIQLTHNTPS